MLLRATPITATSYRAFGDLLAADRDDIAARSANQGTAERKNFQIAIEHDRPLARANFSSFRCAPRTAWPMPIALLEKHPRSTQVFLPLAGGAYVVVVAEGGDRPDLTTLRAFVVRGGVAISYRPGIWHHPMIALDRATDFACLVWEDGSSDDSVEFPTIEAAILLERPLEGDPS